MLRITVLAENTAGGRNLIAEHGLSLWIIAGDRRLLFDTGQGMALGPNARALEIDLGTADGIILSHGHYDHAGGFAQVLSSTRRIPVYAHPNVFESKYSIRSSSGVQDIGMPLDAADSIQMYGDFSPITESTDLGSGVFLTGPIPRLTDFEDVGGPFFRDAAGREPDDLVDDQAMYYVDNDGVAVVLGCAHSGVINTLRYVRELTNGRPIRAVIGGMHLVAATDDRMRKTIEALREFDIRLLGPMHCTGPGATARIWSAFPDRCVALPTGKSIDL